MRMMSAEDSILKLSGCINRLRADPMVTARLQLGL
jgi:hypothetical protein